MEAGAAAQRRIYLDHAATSWPKSERAVQAAADFVRDCGATAGRGAYRSSLAAERWLEDARGRLAKLLGVGSGHALAMCHNGSHALNAALVGLLRSGDHVISTALEHNSVLRPLQALAEHAQIEVSYVPVDEAGVADVAQAADYLRPHTKWLVVGHASNVTGAVQDLAAWGQLARQCGAHLIVDASQTLGYLPLQAEALGIDVLAAAGHKGLRALPGTGLLYVAPRLQASMRPLMYGGTGRDSELLDGGHTWPHCVEVGNVNLAGVVSMAVAAEELLADTAWQSTWKLPFGQLVAGLQRLPAVRLLPDGGLAGRPHVPLVSLLLDGWDVHDVAAILDDSFGIEVRAGWHCAALIHRHLGSGNTGGTLRLSTGHTTSAAEIEATLAAFAAIVS